MPPLARPLPFVLLVVLLAPTLAGCFYSREIAGVRKDIERQYPQAHIEREVVVNAGPGTIRLARWIAGKVPEEETQMAHRYLRDVRRVKVGVYRVEDLPHLDELQLDRLHRFERRGWETAARVREDDEVMWLLYREDAGEIRDLFVLVLDDQELVVVRLRGHLDRLMRKAMEDHLEPGDFIVDW